MLWIVLVGCTGSLLSGGGSPELVEDELPASAEDTDVGLDTDGEVDTGVEEDSGGEETGLEVDTGLDVDTGFGDDEPGTFQWGEVDTDEAWTGFLDSNGTTIRCDVEYALTPVGPATGCPGCSTATTYTLGELEVFANDGGRCEQLGWTGLEGTTLTVGHAAPDVLWQQTGGGWSDVGWSMVTGTAWEFEIEL